MARAFSSPGHDVFTGGSVNESLLRSTYVQQERDILEGEFHRLFADFLLGSSQACRYLAGS